MWSCAACISILDQVPHAFPSKQMGKLGNRRKVMDAVAGVTRFLSKFQTFQPTLLKSHNRVWYHMWWQDNRTIATLKPIKRWPNARHPKVEDPAVKGLLVNENIKSTSSLEKRWRKNKFIKPSLSFWFGHGTSDIRTKAPDLTVYTFHLGRHHDRTSDYDTGDSRFCRRVFCSHFNNWMISCRFHRFGVPSQSAEPIVNKTKPKQARVTVRFHGDAPVPHKTRRTRAR